MSDFNVETKRLTESELAEVGIVMGAYRSFRGRRRDHIAYVSLPITTGKRYFDVLSREGVRTTCELEEKLGTDATYRLIIQPNIREGVALVDRLGRRDDLLFIAPSVFEARRWQWSQDAYMTLWYGVIGEMAGAHFLPPGWEYTIGSVREVLFSCMLSWKIIRFNTLDVVKRAFPDWNLLRESESGELRLLLEEMSRIRIYDVEQRELKYDEMVGLCTEAVINLKRLGFEWRQLFGLTYSLMQTPILSPGRNRDKDEEEFDTELYHASRKRLKSLLEVL